jgi:hypothetical protein
MLQVAVLGQAKRQADYFDERSGKPSASLPPQLQQPYRAAFLFFFNLTEKENPKNPFCVIDAL